ncbi:TadE/TadG family type IV pilus assembly protein [Actibacterium sp. XHP0104]|uniref:TadE/TadG family type IV pilus assembly protein n=1 Tax=Actibacterium sp. XHP0104 TaxID=2984335 RepID=UPI0021E90F0B|nr:TadE/TadG family type IV pilus assembly protein [Actibacterium sp. XHP0104]MCV2881410.1 pilus assembly protein [Actibacterium sp. XHP0104]
MMDAKHILRKVCAPFRRLVRNREGSATVEFVVFVPVFVFMFVSSFEVAVINIRQGMLDQALDKTVRELRLGTWPNPTPAIIKADLCGRTAGIIANCESQLMLELTPVPRDSWTVPAAGANCVDRGSTVEPTVSFNQGGENEMMIVRACLLIDPFFPGTKLALMLEENEGDGIALIATSGFVNEPILGEL